MGGQFLFAVAISLLYFFFLFLSSFFFVYFDFFCCCCIIFYFYFSSAFFVSFFTFLCVRHECLQFWIELSLYIPASKSEWNCEFFKFYPPPEFSVLLQRWIRNSRLKMAKKKLEALLAEPCRFLHQTNSKATLENCLTSIKMTSIIAIFKIKSEMSNLVQNHIQNPVKNPT